MVSKGVAQPRKVSGVMGECEKKGELGVSVDMDKQVALARQEQSLVLAVFTLLGWAGLTIQSDLYTLQPVRWYDQCYLILTTVKVREKWCEGSPYAQKSGCACQR